MRHRSSSLSPLFLSILVLLLGIGLVACGGSSGPNSSQGNSAGTPTAQSGASPTTPASTPTNPVDQPVAQNCGTVSVGMTGAINNSDAAKQTSSCFWQAYQQCRSATMVYRITSLDTASIHTFTIHKNGSTCSVSDHMQHSVVPQPPRDGGTFTCTSVTQTNGQLVFAKCGNAGTIAVKTQ